MRVWFQQMQTGESGHTDKIDRLPLISLLIQTFLQTNWQNHVYGISRRASLFLLISNEMELVRAGMVLLVLSCGSEMAFCFLVTISRRSICLSCALQHFLSLAFLWVPSEGQLRNTEMNKTGKRSHLNLNRTFLVCTMWNRGSKKHQRCCFFLTIKLQ